MAERTYSSGGKDIDVSHQRFFHGTNKEIEGTEVLSPRQLGGRWWEKRNYALSTGSDVYAIAGSTRVPNEIEPGVLNYPTGKADVHKPTLSPEGAEAAAWEWALPTRRLMGHNVPYEELDSASKPMRAKVLEIQPQGRITVDKRLSSDEPSARGLSSGQPIVEQYDIPPARIFEFHKGVTGVQGTLPGIDWRLGVPTEYESMGGYDREEDPNWKVLRSRPKGT